MCVRACACVYIFYPKITTVNILYIVYSKKVNNGIENNLVLMW